MFLMRRNLLIRIKLLPAALSLIAYGCVYVGRPYPVLTIDSDLELVFAHHHRKIVTIKANGEGGLIVAEPAAAAAVPRFSPDGRLIAFYEIGSSARLPFSSSDVTLHVFPVAEDEADNEWISIPLLPFDLDNRLRVDEIIPPLWEPEGGSLIVAHDEGIDRVTLAGDQLVLDKEGKIRSLAMSPDGWVIAYSNDRNIYWLDREDSTRTTVLEPDFVPQMTNLYVRGLAFSPDGSKLAFAFGRKLFVIDTVSWEVEETFEASWGIYWVAWLPGGERLVYLSGREWRRPPFHSSWVYDVRGNYRLAAVDTSGGNWQELFAERSIDVRHAQPALSPDGRFVSVTANSYLPDVFLIATDGSGIARLTTDGPNGFAAWRPGRPATREKSG